MLFKGYLKYLWGWYPVRQHSNTLLPFHCANSLRSPACALSTSSLKVALTRDRSPRSNRRSCCLSLFGIKVIKRKKWVTARVAAGAVAAGCVKDASLRGKYPRAISKVPEMRWDLISWQKSPLLFKITENSMDEGQLNLGVKKGCH